MRNAVFHRSEVGEFFFSKPKIVYLVLSLFCIHGKVYSHATRPLDRYKETNLVLDLVKEMALVWLKVRPMMSRSLLTPGVSDARGSGHRDTRQTLRLHYSSSDKFQSELLFFSTKFHSFKSNPFVYLFFCTFLLFPWLPLSAVLYTISFPPFASVFSHSVLIFLILLSSVPPFLCLIPHPPHSRLLSAFTFICLSPFSPLQACHSIMLLFWFLLIERKFGAPSLSILHF